MRATYKVKSLGFAVPHFSLSLACVASVSNRVRPNFSPRTRAETLATQATLSPPRLASLAWGGGGGGGEDFHVRSLFAGSNIPVEKWGLLVV